MANKREDYQIQLNTASSGGLDIERVKTPLTLILHIILFNWMDIAVWIKTAGFGLMLTASLFKLYEMDCVDLWIMLPFVSSIISLEMDWINTGVLNYCGSNLRRRTGWKDWFTKVCSESSWNQKKAGLVLNENTGSRSYCLLESSQINSHASTDHVLLTHLK